MAGQVAARPLSRAELPAILGRIHALLALHRQEVDALNVFPVPDGDTGTNMTATARAAVDILADIDDDADPAERSRAIARAALRGARGNSGVILSQVLRALVTAVAEEGELDAARFAAALETARELSYEAVADPVEGTILTTIRRASVRARGCATEGTALGPCLAAVLEEVDSATVDTGQMLQANRDAGVVDAGARGFALVIAALSGHVNGHPAEPAPLRRQRIERSEAVVAARESGSAEYRFEVQYLLDAEEGAAAPLRDRLRAIGDSVVVVAADDLVSVHVHTNEVGQAIEAGLEHGRPSDIAVVYFADQVAADDLPAAVALGCVAVLPSGPLHVLAREHGAVPVAGTSGDLPSVDDLIHGIRHAHAERVVVLPGHRNAVPTAIQARDIAHDEHVAEVEVVRGATSVPAVVAALAVFHPEAGEDTVVADMGVAVAAVRTGEVVPAVRDAQTPIGPVRQGQHLTIVGDDVVATSDDPLDALRTLTGHYAGGPCELVTLIVGDEVSNGEREQAVATVREVLGDVEVEVVEGRQRPARYLVGVE